MRNVLHYNNVNDEQGNPAGGFVTATGLDIRWQAGPLGRHAPGCIPFEKCVPGCTRIPPNGAFVEDVLEAALQRLQHYQDSKFACLEIAAAMDHIQDALALLDERTADRQLRHVEGTHEL